METYRVGGAVRDTLLGYPHQEIDWVVVGSTPEEMTAAGYTQVGRTSPFSCIPTPKRSMRWRAPSANRGRVITASQFTQTLPLRLRKISSAGTSPSMPWRWTATASSLTPTVVKLTSDAKILRHVSPHFVEDPLRVLRVARFAARYHYLGFVVAEETQRLMAEIVAAGELTHLSTERVWVETEKALGEEPRNLLPGPL